MLHEWGSVKKLLLWDSQYEYSQDVAFLKEWYLSLVGKVFLSSWIIEALQQNGRACAELSNQLKEPCKSGSTTSRKAFLRDAVVEMLQRPWKASKDILRA